jgi:hypothetical protein
MIGSGQGTAAPLITDLKEGIAPLSWKNEADEKSAISDVGTRHYSVLDLLETSYRNCPEIWD